MKQTVKDTYSIAWFKIAQFVHKGERERALGLYRLLAHSIDDSAFACQLEGDILLYFKDEKAIVKYKEAATLYAGQFRFAAAISLYDHLLTMGQDKLECLSTMLAWAISSGHAEKVKLYGMQLAEMYLAQQKNKELMTTLGTLIAHAGACVTLITLVDKTLQLTQTDQEYQVPALEMVRQLIDRLLMKEEVELLSLLMHMLEHTHPQIYNAMQLG